MVLEGVFTSCSTVTVSRKTASAQVRSAPLPSPYPTNRFVAERCVVRVEQLSQEATDPDRPASSPKASVRSERQFGQKAASNITDQERNIPEAPATHYVLIRLSLQEEFRATATSQAKNQV